jgi:tetratricopeptide (TPR) repeat protein
MRMLSVLFLPLWSVPAVGQDEGNREVTAATGSSTDPASIDAKGMYEHELGERLHRRPQSSFLQILATPKLGGRLGRLGVVGVAITLLVWPTLASADISRGEAYSRKGNYDTALADFTSALSLNPVDFVTLNNRGNVYGDINRPDLAIEDYSASIQVNGSYAPAFYNRGKLRIEKGEIAGGNADIAFAKLLEPSLP